MKILVVDDQPLNRNFLKAMLIKDGYEVELAADGLEALEKLRSENFDLIIGVTALTQEPDYCAVVVRYEEN